MSYALTLLAPQTSGHPVGLPAPPLDRDDKTAPVAAGKGLSDGSAGAQNSDAGGSDEPPSHAAPPTMLQMKINSMLQEQAEALAESDGETGLDDTPDAHPTKTGSADDFARIDTTPGGADSPDPLHAQGERDRIAASTGFSSAVQDNDKTTDVAD